MATTTMTASLFLSGSALTITKQTITRRCLVVAKASTASEGEKPSLQINSKAAESSGRRDLVLAAAAAAAAAMSVAKIAMAEGEPKAGTPEAKKKYATVCVTMPTARICRR